jgi:hypothetical protein
MVMKGLREPLVDLNLLEPFVEHTIIAKADALDDDSGQLLMLLMALKEMVWTCQLKPYAERLFHRSMRTLLSVIPDATVRYHPFPSDIQYLC